MEIYNDHDIILIFEKKMIYINTFCQLKLVKNLIYFERISSVFSHTLLAVRLNCFDLLCRIRLRKTCRYKEFQMKKRKPQQMQ